MLSYYAGVELFWCSLPSCESRQWHHSGPYWFQCSPFRVYDLPSPKQWEHIGRYGKQFKKNKLRKEWWKYKKACHGA
jgi:hypothetical protein